MSKQFVTIHTVGENQQKEQIDASITLPLDSIFLVEDHANTIFSVNSVVNPMVGWNVTESQFREIEKMLKSKKLD